MRDDALRKADERRRFLYDKSGAQALNLVMGLLAVAVMVLAYVDQVAFRTVYVTLCVLLVLRFGLLAYYSRKYWTIVYFKGKAAVPAENVPGRRPKLY